MGPGKLTSIDVRKGSKSTELSSWTTAGLPSISTTVRLPLPIDNHHLFSCACLIIGFGGGSLVSENLMFNSCRESSDHGVFNSWDRQVYCTDIDQDYDPSAPANFKRKCIKQYDEIRNNFFVGNYHANRGGVDNDDG